MMVMKEDFRVNIRKLRKNQNLTQKMLSKQLGFSESYIRLLEKGDCNPRLSTLRRISSFFEKDISWLLGEPISEQSTKKERFCERLKRLRNKNELTQEDMIYGIDSEDGAMLEYSILESGQGNPTYKTLLVISERLGVTIGDLVDGTTP